MIIFDEGGADMPDNYGELIRLAREQHSPPMTAKQLAEESAHGIFWHGRGTQHTGQQTDKESGDRTYQ